MSARVHPLIAPLIVLLLIIAWDATGLDLRVVRLFGDATGFSLRDHWLFSKVLHDGVRMLSWMVLAILLATCVVPQRFGLSGPLQRRWVLISTIVAIAVPAIKQISLTSCPWSLAEFGAIASYVPHWMPGQLDGGPGRCFPSGHVVNAFAFLPGWLLYRQSRTSLARAILAGVLAVGLLSGIAQIVRGAHYPSHILWAAWLCWVIAALGSGLALRRLQRTGRSAEKAGSAVAAG